MEKRAWRRFIAFMLSVLMVVGVVNIPTDIVRAESDDCYTITYEGNGGYFGTTWDDESGIDVPNYTPTESEILKGESIGYNWWTPTRPKYIFTGYKIKDSETLYIIDSSKELETGEEYLEDYVPTGDVTFYAQWAEANTVTYDGNGGYFGTTWDEDSGAEVPDYTPVTVDIEKGKKIGNNGIYPYNREGYSFLGYKKDGSDKLYVGKDSDSLEEGEVSLLDYVPTGDVTFYAQWADTYEITYDFNGGSNGEIWDEGAATWVPDYSPRYYSILKGSKIGYEYPTPDDIHGYTFTGYKIEDSDTLYVTYNSDSYQLKTGEAFLSEYKPTGNVTFTAQWEDVDYLDIKVDPNGGYVYDEDNGEKEYDIHDLTYYFPSTYGFRPGSCLSVYLNCRKAGMVFDGWKLESDGNVYKRYYPITFTGDDTLTAQYSDAVVVAMDLNGGYYTYASGPGSSYKYYGDPWYTASEDGKINISNICISSDEEGKAFAGWKKEGDDTLYSSDDINKMTFTDDETFVAQWVDGYQVTFYSEEGYMKDYSADEKIYKVNVKKNDVFSGHLPIRTSDCYSRYGYYIEYWTLSGDTKKYTDSDILSMKVDKDLTFTAHWKKASIITYDANGGYINLSLSLTELRRTGEKLSYKEASKNGFTLEGWLVNDESSLDGSVITDLTTYVVGGDATFTAQWEKKNPDDYCTVQYDPNGGYFHNGPYVNYDNSEYEYKKGTTIQLIGIGQPNRPYKDGANLVGWIIKDGDGTVYKPCEYIDGELVGGEYTVTGDVTFVAVWDDDWVNITYTTEDGDYGKDEKGQPIKQLVTKVEPGKPIEAYDAPRCEGKLFMGFKVEGTDEIIYNGDYLKTIGKDPKDYTTILGYVPTTDMTLDALWDDDVYTITFESNYGVDGDPYVVFETIYAKKGCNIPEYPWATTDEKKEFIGYKIKGDTSGKIYEKGYVTYEDGEFFQIVANSDMTFEAVFVDGYEVTVDCDGGISKTYDEEYKTSTLIFEKNKPFPKKAWYGDELDNLYKTNYVLKGWKIIDDPDEKIYEDIADIVITRDMTIKAVWDGDCSTLGHDLEEHEANDATCEEGGNSAYWSCKRCGKYFSDAEGETEIEEGSWIILPPGHSMEGFAANEASCVENGNSEYWYCGRCDKYFSDAEGKDEIEENSWIIPATGHDLEEHAANEVSCEEDGNSAYWYCKKCDKYFSDSEGTTEIEAGSWIIPSPGHDPVEDWGSSVEPTCTSGGKGPDMVCSRCGVILEFGAPETAYGHELEGYAANDATCEVDGNSAYWHCGRCEKYFSDAEGETEIEEGSWIIPAPGHDLVDVDGTAKEATCTEAGREADKNCSRCDYHEEGQTILALGHNMTSHAANDATCEEAGNSAYWYCDRCEKYFSDAEGTKEIEKDSWIIPKLGHDLTEHEAKEAACKQAGNSAYWSCKNCDKYFSDAEGKTKIEKDSWVIPALSHNMTLHEANDATCEEAGNSAYWYCDKCEKYYSDAEGTKEIEENSWIISAKGHFYGKEIAEVPVTCTEDGTKAHYKCSNCGKLFVKDGSDYVLTTEEALKIKSEGHKEETVGAKEPSCTEPGHKAGKKCSVCGKTLEGLEEIPALDHTPVTDPAVEATTEKTGLTEGSHCSVCGTVLKKQETVPKKEDPKKAEEEAKKKAEEEAKKNQKTEYSNEWVDGKWYDANGINNYTATLQWKSDATGWWVQDTDNWYPADSWQKIDGVWYYFKPDGYMATNEYYNGYWFNADGSWDPQYNLSWMSNATGWWVEDISGWWPADAWLKIDGCWYYFDGSGYMVSNCYIDGYWIGADGVCR